jgi:hypothetical protein
MADIGPPSSGEIALQNHNEATRIELDRTTDNDPRDPATPASTPREKYPSKSSNLRTYLALSRTKGIKDLAKADLEKRKRADQAEAKIRKANESRERKVRQEQELKEHQERRKASKERAKQNGKAKAEKRAEEKRVSSYYGIRGFDPNAGMLQSNRGGEAGGKAREEDQSAEEIPGSPGPQARSGQTWGVEFGKPKDHRGKGHIAGHHNNCGERY